MDMPTAIDERVLCIVPARSGSERVLNKNLLEVGGISLLARAVMTGKSAFGRVFVSTDDEAYAEIAVGCGALVPSLRPAELARPTVMIEAVLGQAIRAWGTFGAEVLIVIQPTSPFLKAEEARRVAQVLRDVPTARSALTAVRAAAKTAFVMYEDGEGMSRFGMPSLAARRTQEIPHLAIPSGGAYAVRIRDFVECEQLIIEPIATVVVDEDDALDIDDWSDVEAARAKAETAEERSG